MQPSWERFRTGLNDTIDRYAFRIEQREEGRVVSSSDGVAKVAGLMQARLDEVLDIEGTRALAMDLSPTHIGAILLDKNSVPAGASVRCTGTVAATPVGESLLGRVVDPLGQPLDGGSRLRGAEQWTVERAAPPLDARAPVTEPLITGIAVVDALFPIGRGQRQLLLGDRGTGKTTIALDAIVNQRKTGVRCVYVSIGQMASDVATVIETLRSSGSLAHTVVVTAESNASPGIRFLAPYAGCSIAEWFRDRGEDVFLVLDDLTAHAIAYRELSLLLRRAPGREAFPGDVFYIHSRLLERSARLTDSHGGGSLTALPLVQTRAGRIADFIPTNIISITDGQLVLDRSLFERGIKPAVDIRTSVSRVGAKTQRASLSAVAGKLRLELARFLELEVFTRFGARLEDETQRLLARGARARELLKQRPGHALSLSEQVTRLLALNEGLFDDIDERAVRGAAARLTADLREHRPDILDDFERGREIQDAHRVELRSLR